MKLTILPALLALSCAAALAKPNIESAWRRDEIKIDGVAAEWQGALSDLDGTALLMGARNDGENLYICIVASGPGVARQVTFRGLMVEIEAKGEKPLKIEYPVSPFEEGGPPARRPGEQGGPSGPGPAGRDRLLVVFDPATGQRQWIPVDNELGIEARTSSEGGRFVYEAKIPLARVATHPYAVGASPGARIALMVETPKIDPAMLPPGGGRGWRGGMGGGMRGGRGGRGGGMGGGGGQGPGGGRGGPEGQTGGDNTTGGEGRRGARGGQAPEDAKDQTDFSPPKPLKFKANIVLASAPLTDQAAPSSPK